MDDASKSRSIVLKIFVILGFTGLTNGSKLDDLLDDHSLLLYVAIGLLCFAVLFLFFVILLISIAIIRVQKIRKAQKEEDEIGGRISETIIANPNVLHHPPGRSSIEPTKWERHPNAGKNGGKRESKGNVPMDHLEYMDLIIVEAGNVNLPRAKKIEDENREKTV